MNINGSIAFVTGANRGLGLALARGLLARGASKVYAGVRDPASLTEPGLIPIQLDVTDAASITAAAARCPDVSLLVNNAGIGRLNDGLLAPSMLAVSREVFETNFYGLIATTQAFGPALVSRGGGAIVNVLSDVSWHARPMLAAYAATKSAAWSFTNALRLELRESRTQVLALHVGFMDTDMTAGLSVGKTAPSLVAERTLNALAEGADEVLADEQSRAVKLGLISPRPYYLHPPPIV